VEPGEGQLRLRFHADAGEYPEPGRAGGPLRRAEQRGLADAGIAEKHEGLPGLGALADQLGQRADFPVPADQHRGCACCHPDADGCGWCTSLAADGLAAGC